MRRLPPVRRLVPLALLVALAAGCGSSEHAATVPKAPPSPARLLGPGGSVLYAGGDWAVVRRGGQVVAAHLIDGTWRADRSGVVKVRLLGTHKRSKPLPQVAAEISGPSRIVEEGLWIDGVELLEKGGGLKPSRITVYGAPNGNLQRGPHVAIAYGRTQMHGTAVAFAFTVV
jgi:hypothetical protein